MRIKFVLALLILLFACALQSWLTSVNIFMDLILASLIAFAFFFDVLDLIVFILFGVFVINWQPVISPEIILFAIIPLVAYGFHKWFALIPWVAIPVAIIVGFLLLYLAVAPSMFFANWAAFLTDLLGGLVFGEFVLLALSKTA